MCICCSITLHIVTRAWSSFMYASDFNQGLIFTQWGEGQPDDYWQHEDYVEVNTQSGVWNDLSLTYERHTICERRDLSKFGTKS